MLNFANPAEKGEFQFRMDKTEKIDGEKEFHENKKDSHMQNDVRSQAVSNGRSGVDGLPSRSGRGAIPDL
jgi:hypothetical protein